MSTVLELTPGLVAAIAEADQEFDALVAQADEHGRDSLDGRKLLRVLREAGKSPEEFDAALHRLQSVRSAKDTLAHADSLDDEAAGLLAEIRVHEKTIAVADAEHKKVVPPAVEQIAILRGRYSALRHEAAQIRAWAPMLASAKPLPVPAEKQPQPR